MADDCANCGALQNQVARLMGGIAGTLALIHEELEEKPTMSRHQLVLVVQERLHDTFSSAY